MREGVRRLIRHDYIPSAVILLFVLMLLYCLLTIVCVLILLIVRRDPALAASLLRLAFHDAISRDTETRTGSSMGTHV